MPRRKPQDPRRAQASKRARGLERRRAPERELDHYAPRRSQRLDPRSNRHAR